jgi:hypothetical protein
VSAGNARRSPASMPATPLRVSGNSTAGMTVRRVKSHAITIAEALPTSTGTATSCRNGTSSVCAVHPST